MRLKTYCLSIILATLCISTVLAADRWEHPVWPYIPGSYEGRSFFYGNDHLGEDEELTEGMAIRSIGAGVIKYYSSSSGYGELVVAIEHDLGKEYSFTNAYGENMNTRYILSIYGHLRDSQTRGGTGTGLLVGQTVSPGDTVGYVNNSSHPDGIDPDPNEDGLEHLHMGIRLSDAATAQARDGDYWLRGYNTNKGTTCADRCAADFAAASTVIEILINSNPVLPPIKWPLQGNLADRTIITEFGDDWLHGEQYECPPGVVKNHVGIDVSATVGENVYAPEAGVVKERLYDSLWKWCVTIEHSGFTSVCWHVDPLVNKGESVKRGEIIGTVADLGTNTHLHFGVRARNYSDISNRGALPQNDCGGNPGFPEYFVDPKTLNYNSYDYPMGMNAKLQTAPAVYVLGTGGVWHPFFNWKVFNEECNLRADDIIITRCAKLREGIFDFINWFIIMEFIYKLGDS